MKHKNVKKKAGHVTDSRNNDWGAQGNIIEAAQIILQVRQLRTGASKTGMLMLGGVTECSSTLLPFLPNIQ